MTKKKGDPLPHGLVARYGFWQTVIVGVLGLVSAVTVAAFGLLQVQAQLEIPIHATQTAAAASFLSTDTSVPTKAPSSPAVTNTPSSTGPSQDATLPAGADVQAGCISFDNWVPNEGERSHSVNAKGCWELADWGMYSQAGALNLQLLPSEADGAHGIYTPIPQYAVVKATIRIDRLETVRQKNANLSIGIVDITDRVTSGKLLYYWQTAAGNPVSLMFGDWDSYDPLTLRAYSYQTTQQAAFSVEGDHLNAYIDGRLVQGPIPLPIGNRAFWIGYSLPAGANLLAYITEAAIQPQ